MNDIANNVTNNTINDIETGVRFYRNLETLMIDFSKALEKAMIFLFIIMIIMVIIAFILYVIKSIGLYKLTIKEKTKHRWISWIPLINNIMLSKLSFNNYYIGVIIIALFMFRILTINTTKRLDELASLAFYTYIVLNIICAYKIFKKHCKHYKIMTIFSCLTFGFTIPFMLCAIKTENKENIEQ